MFKTEANLVSSIISIFQANRVKIQSFNKGNKIIRSELKIGYGVPDLVVVKTTNKNNSHRKSCLSYFDLSVLGTIEREQQITFADIVNVTCSTKSKIQSSLSLLLEEKLIKKIDDDIFSFHKYEYSIANSIAIEAKLKNRKRALNQAYRYKWFSNISYVILPEQNIQPALKNIDDFKKLRVGLAGISNYGKLVNYYEPPFEHPISEQMKKFLNEYILSDLHKS